MFILLPTTRMMRSAFSHDDTSLEISRCSGNSEHDYSRSYAARAGSCYQSSLGAETEHYASPESLSASSSGVNRTTACPRIAARTSAPAGVASEMQKRSPVSTQGFQNAQHSCPYDGFSARAAEVSSKTFLLSKEVSPDACPDKRVPTATELLSSAVKFRTGRLRRHSESGNEALSSFWYRKLKASR